MTECIAYRLLRRGQPGGPRVIMFPWAGGSASGFIPVASALPARCEVAAIQYPARQDRLMDPHFRDIGVLADLLSQVVAEASGVPYVLLGHSMGALVAYEVATRLATMPCPQPHHLFISACGAPGTKRELPRTDHELLSRVSELGGMPDEVRNDPELLHLTLSALRDDFAALSTYRPSTTRLNTPITVLLGREDQSVSRASATGWAERTRRGIDVVLLPGGHFFLTKTAGPAAAAIGDRIAAHLSVDAAPYQTNSG